METVLLEIRPGTGGLEASLWAADLLRMYQKFSQKQGWKITEVEVLKDNLGGIKKAVCQVSGTGVFEKLKGESGVHRVQRIPKTEVKGRVHTSTATVAVLPETKGSTALQINPPDLKIEFYRAASHGGQNVNKVETAVRITHLPSGVTVNCQEERYQHQNRERALRMLTAKLREQETGRVLKETQGLRREQIGEGERAEKIRTYNFPQNRVTDHRINKSWRNLESILTGNLQPYANHSQ